MAVAMRLRVTLIFLCLTYAQSQSSSSSTESSSIGSSDSMVSSTVGSTSTESAGPTSTTSSTTTAGTTTTSSTTTTARPRHQCVPIKGPVRLRSNGASPCIVKRFNMRSIQYRSPLFPKKYPNNVECNARTSSAAPHFLEVTLTLFKVHKHDRLILKGPFRYSRRLKKADLNTPIYLPSAFSRIIFKSNDKKRRKGFKLKVISKNNKCQRLCNLGEGDKGIIKNGPYGSNTFCEWWMEAPAGCYIRLTFMKFDVGEAGSGGAWGCEGDYVGVDRGGDPTYSHPNSRTFCGSTLPKHVRSVDNKMMVLFNGREGGYQGFRAMYQAVCK